MRRFGHELSTSWISSLQNPSHSSRIKVSNVLEECLINAAIESGPNPWKCNMVRCRQDEDARLRFLICISSSGLPVRHRSDMSLTWGQYWRKTDASCSIAVFVNK